MIELLTGRLVVRDHVWEDLEDHHQLLSDPVVMRFLPDLTARTLEESRANLAAAIREQGEENRRLYFFCIRERESGDHVGEIGYTISQTAPLGHLAEAGYFLREAFWGRGYTAEALEAVLRYAFEEGNVHRLTAGCLLENTASERVMQKCGLIKEAERRECQWHGGRWKDRVEYRLLRREWRERQNG